MRAGHARRACRHGDVESVRLRNVPVDTESKMPKALQIKAGKVAGERGSATAFVRFAATESVAAALASNMALFEGAHIRVDRAAAPSRGGGGVQYEAKRSVFLGNLAFDTQVRAPQGLLKQAASTCDVQHGAGCSVGGIGRSGLWGFLMGCASCRRRT